MSETDSDRRYEKLKAKLCEDKMKAAIARDKKQRLLKLQAKEQAKLKRKAQKTAQHDDTDARMHCEKRLGVTWCEKSAMVSMTACGAGGYSKKRASKCSVRSEANNVQVPVQRQYVSSVTNCTQKRTQGVSACGAGGYSKKRASKCSVRSETNNVQVPVQRQYVSSVTNCTHKRTQGVSAKKTAGKLTKKKNRSAEKNDKLLDEQRRKIKERVRKHRAKMTEEGKDKRRSDDREYRKQRKLKGMDKPIKELSHREKRSKRKRWAAYARVYRQRKAAASVSLDVSADTPITPSEWTVALDRASSSRKQVGRRQVRIGRSQVVRELLKSREELKAGTRQCEQMKRVIDKYRKRMFRSKNMKLTPSPATKVNRMTAAGKITPGIRKRLLFGEVLAKSLQDKRNKCNRQDSQVLAKVVASALFRKYNLIGAAAGMFGYKMFARAVGSTNFMYEKKQLVRGGRLKESKQVEEFLQEDKYSRMCPGKRDQKKKAQKRILLYTMKELHQKYQREFSSSLSYSTFLRLRPYWIVQPRIVDRNTCACAKHANIQFVVTKLHQLKLLPPTVSHAEKVCAALCCNTKNRHCMYRLCDECHDKMITEPIPVSEEDDAVNYFRWERKTESRVIKGKSKNITFMHKANIATTKRGLVKEFEALVGPFMQHIFTKEHQQDEMKAKRASLKKNETIIQVDFSENYVCKYGEETQGMHFGASKVQLSLHTGVQYIANEITGKATVKSFATVSSCLDHGAYAIWAHLTPILSKLSQNHPEVDTIHFLSDGPTAQYRNRFNMFLLVSHLQTICPSVRYATWNYSEAGHGKGPMDGIGGLLKKSADDYVARGNDIPSVAVFISHLIISCPCVDLSEISNEDIERAKLLIPKKVTPVPGVMDLHQVSWDKDHGATLFTRMLSCFACDMGAVCSHFNRGKVVFSVPVSYTVEAEDNSPSLVVEAVNEAADNTSLVTEAAEAEDNCLSLVLEAAMEAADNISLVMEAAEAEDNGPSLVVEAVMEAADNTSLVTEAAEAEDNCLSLVLEAVMEAADNISLVMEAAEAEDNGPSLVVEAVMEAADNTSLVTEAAEAEDNCLSLVVEAVMEAADTSLVTEAAEAEDNSLSLVIEAVEAADNTSLVMETNDGNLTQKLQPVDVNGNDLIFPLLVPSLVSQFKLGMWIAAIYGKRWYPGKLEEIHADHVTVNFMQRLAGNKFAWPKRRDLQEVELDDVLCILPAAPEAENINKFIISGVDNIDQLLAAC